MRARLLLFALFFATPVFAQTPDSILAARDGDGTTRFRVNVDGGTFFGGAYDGGIESGGIPVEGPGTRLMWYPRKAAFRAGNVSGTEWDDASVGYFSTAAGQDVVASGESSVAFGLRSLATGDGAFAVGEGNTASGATSIALGYHAHTDGQDGTFVFADRSSVDSVRAGAANTATWRVSGGFRIFTASNLTTGVTIQSGASVSNWGQSSAVISTSTGALLTTGGVWQNASDSTRKHLYEPVSGEDVLARLRTLPIRRWSYRAEPATVKHLGPTSQDFKAAFGLGSDERSIGTVDADGVALAAAQALEVRTREQQAHIEALQAEQGALQSEFEALNARLDVLEAGGTERRAGLPLLALLAVAGAAGFFVRRRSARPAH